MAATVSWEALRELATFRAEDGCAISVYVDLDPSVAPTAGDAASRINSLISEGERRSEGGRKELAHDQRQGLKADLERIRRYFDQDFSRDGAHGVAVFSAGLDNFWRVLPLSESVADAIKIGSQFYLAPLVPLVGRGDGALVAVVGRERGEVYRLQAGRLEELVEQFDEQPGQHMQGGWSQARYQRHIEELAAQHLRAVGDILDRQVRRLGGPRVVVVCGEETRPDFEQVLSNEVRNAIAGWTQAEAHATPAVLLAAAQPVLEDWRAAEEAAAIERWREEAGRNGRAASGWAGTLEAASDGRVEVLLFQDGAARPAWQCPACGRAGAEGGACPLDGRQMEQREDGLDIAVHHTLAHGGTVCAVRHRQDLEPVEGIGALLRY